MQELTLTQIPLHGTHLIEASAGTGKTYSILRIYLRLLLQQKHSVHQILVMTFTNAATAELRNRLSEFLREIRAEWQTSTEPVVMELRKELPSAEADLLLKQAILHLDEASIFTIHGFCKRALGEQAFLSGVSFNLQLEGDSSELIIQAAQDWYRNNIDNDAFAELYNQWPTPEGFVSHWKLALTTSDDVQRPQTADISPLWQDFLAHWEGEREAFVKLNIEAKLKQDRLDKNHEDLAWLDAAYQQHSTEPLQHLLSDVVKRCFDGKKKQAELAHTAALLPALQSNRKAELINFALDGVEFIRQRVSNEKDRLERLDFNDLIIQLSQSLQAANGDALGKALLETYPAVLVDEFQDTDPDQYAILNRIYGNAPSAFMCLIGDPKQAIYSFRGGDVFAYLKAKEQAHYHWWMNTNYRSAQGVVDGYNQIFIGKNAAETFGFGIGYQAVQAAKEAISFSDDSQRAAVQWVALSPTEVPSRGLNKAFCEQIARWCSNEIIQLISAVTANGQAVKPGDIALLVRSHTEATLLQNALTAAGLSSVFLSARANVFHSDEARQLYQLLSGIWKYENDRLFIAALASNWLQLSVTELDELQHDEFRWVHWQSQFEDWRNQWQRNGLMSMLLDILQLHFKPSAADANRQLTNMLHLAELLQKESTRLRKADALLHWFALAMDEQHGTPEENTLRLESDDELIKIITMHGSKGLEYPVVFLPFVAYHGSSTKTPAVLRYHSRQDFSAHQSYLHNSDILRLANEEDEAERIRLFYVAATRAKLRLYICAAPFGSFKNSALARTLKLDKFSTGSFAEIENTGLLQVNTDALQDASWQPTESRQQPHIAEFTGRIERDWWLSSFSALTRHISHSNQSLSSHSQPDRDEDQPSELPAESDQLRFRLAKGAEAGNLLHDAFEVLDFQSPDFAKAYENSQTRYPSLTESFAAAEFSQWLNEILNAPLPRGGKLADLPMEKTLREAEFYFPMQGQQADALAAFIRKHRNADYYLPERNRLKGMMHGFIDLIFEHDGRFYVADYKSTFLGTRLDDYHPAAVTLSVFHSSYDVQYLIYSLALHRYLKTRLPGYNPEQHFGGVYYLYLRGMNTDNSNGIYFTGVSQSELDALDAIFSEPQPLNQRGAAHE
ncbi:exodeoxyribonuclease V subunit beta [Reinekea marinisedimentorum]|uniref:RecBCD enzyme subunit RecB n=1 Tax=Reinekea marinisedimentorum TaxID=230495 RepID=A0A4R3I5Z7_9GAMM|nr:exodeoxyribonuclease V subunit beta [Reinekea marinisedimentorum]TCS41118.1 DNA helicase/exodeoxyribonuclease V beta subunit [Reinekea marinisedimentorum]